MLLARTRRSPWETGSKENRRVELRSLYSCEQLCKRTRDNPSGDHRARAASRCSLVDFDSDAWDPEADPEAAAEAEAKAEVLLTQAAKQRIDLDFELDRDGCPHGWALSPYGQRVLLFAGNRSVDSPIRQYPPRMQRLIHHSEDTELLEAVEIFEAYEDSAFALFHQVCNG